MSSMEQQQRQQITRQQDPLLPPTDMLTRSKAQSLLKQIVDGKLDGVLPPVPAGSPDEDRLEAEMAAYMDTFKMQVCLLRECNSA